MGANASKRGSCNLHKKEKKDKKKSALLKTSSVVNLTQAQIYEDEAGSAPNQPETRNHFVPVYTKYDDQIVYENVSEVSEILLEEQIEVTENKRHLINSNDKEEAEQEIKIPSNGYTNINTNDKQVLVRDEELASGNRNVYNILENIEFSFEHVEKENEASYANLQNSHMNNNTSLTKTTNQVEKVERALIEKENPLLYENTHQLQSYDNEILNSQIVANNESSNNNLINSNRKNNTDFEDKINYTHEERTARTLSSDNVDITSTETNFRLFSSQSWNELFEKLLVCQEVISTSDESGSTISAEAVGAEDQIEAGSFDIAPHQKPGCLTEQTNVPEKNYSHQPLSKTISDNSDVYYELSEESADEPELFFDAVPHEEFIIRPIDIENTQAAVTLDNVKENENFKDTTSEAEIVITAKLLNINDSDEDESQVWWALNGAEEETSKANNAKMILNSSIDEAQVEVINNGVNVTNDNKYYNKSTLSENLVEASNIWLSEETANEIINNSPKNINNSINIKNNNTVESVDYNEGILMKNIDLINFEEALEENQIEVMDKWMLCDVGKDTSEDNNKDDQVYVANNYSDTLNDDQIEVQPIKNCLSNNSPSIEAQPIILETPIDYQYETTINNEIVANKQNFCQEVKHLKEKCPNSSINVHHDKVNLEKNLEYNKNTTNTNEGCTEEPTPENIAWHQMQLWNQQQGSVTEEVINEITDITAATEEVKIKIKELKSHEDRTEIYLTLIKLMREVNKINNNHFNEKVISLLHEALSDINDCLKQLQH